MSADKTYCASSFLMYRTVIDEDKTFYDGVPIEHFHLDFPRTPVSNGRELLDSLQKQMAAWTADGKAALALSAGMDSAILAKLCPKGTTAYTFQCVVPGVEVTNEVPRAKEFAAAAGLKQVVVPIYWEDFEKFSPLLMRHKGAPFHSIEVQIYKAALQAKKDGFERLIFGETADLNYGGMDSRLKANTNFGEYVDREIYVMPYQVLKEFQMPLDPFAKYTKDGYVDVHEYLRGFVLEHGVCSYFNACSAAGIEMIAPFLNTYMATPLDYARVRSGESKYIVREVFKELYGDYEMPPKVPMPRATNEWFKDWEGPHRPEFWAHCTDHMTGDQKWLVWCLERFFEEMEK